MNHVQQQNTWKSVASLLRNEVNNSNSYQISRALSDMEKEGWIKCVTLSETSNGDRPFYDTTTQSYCGYFSDKTSGVLQAINGSTWNMTFASPENIWLHLIRLIVPILFTALFLIARNYIEKVKNQQDAVRLKTQLEKDFLLDLTKQTKHDIASPIGALRIVIPRLDVPPEHAEILRNITDRIEGIFSQLKSLEENPFEQDVAIEEVDIANVITAIVLEKTKEWNLPFSAIHLELSPGKVIGNKNEIGRIISNILNNSIEAIPEGHLVEIRILSVIKDGIHKVQISDNGQGIPSNVLSKVGSKGFSHGKDNKKNSGIGLYHAKKTLTLFGAGLSIDSTEGAGTKVVLRFKTPV